MDFENLMVTPAIYRDIPSSMMFAPYMMSPYTMSPLMMPPLLGITGQIPQMPKPLSNDSFERIQAKDKESKNSMAKAGIAVAALAVAGWFLSKRIKLPQSFKNFFQKITPSKAKIKNAVTAGKSKVSNLFGKGKAKVLSGINSAKNSAWFGKVKNLFKKSKAVTP